MSTQSEQTKASQSHSQAKREARKKEIAQAKRNATITKIVIAIIAIVVVAGIGASIGFSIYKSAQQIKPNANYSAKLDDHGYIKGVNASSLVTLPEYRDITIPLSEIEFSEEDIQADIDAKCDLYPDLNKDEALAAADGDKVNVDYTGVMDGVEFEGGSATDYTLTLGSQTFIDTFEEQIEGHHPGETFEVNVTFPEDYSNTDLAGKPAVFTVTLNGIYQKAEFTDEFVATNLAAYADTTDGYIQYLKDTNYDKNLDAWVENYLTENATVSSYPKSYLKQLKCLEKNNKINEYETTNQYYQQYYGRAGYSSLEEYLNMSEAEYDATLQETCEGQAKADLVYQAIAEAEGFVPTTDDFLTYLKGIEDINEDAYAEQIETYGAGYVLQTYLREYAKDIVKDTANVQ